MLKRVQEIMGETSVYGLMNPFDSDSIDNKENIIYEILDEDDENDSNPEEVFSVSYILFYYRNI